MAQITVGDQSPLTREKEDPRCPSDASQHVAPELHSPGPAAVCLSTSERKPVGRWLPLLALVTPLLLQLVLSGAGQWNLWSPSVEHVVATQARTEPAGFLPFVQSHVPSGAVVIYVTPSEGIGEHWAYIQMSYQLYPSTVWWVTPTPKTSQMDPWIQSPLMGGDLSRLAAARAAGYVVFSGLDVPEGMPYKSVLAFDAERSVLQLK